jgi:guanylate kinase
MGVSGGGKGTVRGHLLAHHPTIVEPPSATTRPMRPGDVEGDHYHFVDIPTFLQMIEKGEFLEYTMYCGNYYGTIKKLIEDALATGHDVNLEVEMEGADKILRLFPDARAVFLVAPDYDTLRHRLMQRGTTGADLELRIETSMKEIAWATERRVPIIVNEHLEKTVQDVEDIFFGETYPTLNLPPLG